LRQRWRGVQVLEARRGLPIQQQPWNSEPQHFFKKVTMNGVVEALHIYDEHKWDTDP
jgi:hypothetical protein